MEHALHFDYHLSLDDEITLIVADVDALVDERDLALAFESNFLLREFDVQRVQIGAFEESRAEIAVNLDRAADDALGKWICSFHV